MAKEILEMAIETATMELPDTKTIKLKWPEGHNPDFKTGQFITLYWPDSTNYKRAYSLSSCALDRGFYEVTVKRDGKMGTRIVDWAKAGDKMFVIPPVGKFLPVYPVSRVCPRGHAPRARHQNHGALQRAYPRRYYFQHGVSRAGKGQPEFQVPCHLHACPG
jgi:hypothetical protein